MSSCCAVVRGGSRQRVRDQRKRGSDEMRGTIVRVGFRAGRELAGHPGKHLHAQRRLRYS